MKINIKAEIGENCITVEDGKKVFGLIHSELLENRPVELDFTEVEVFASPFLNAAIGHLLKDIKPDTLNNFLKISSMSSSGREVLRKVIENSKAYYSNPDTRRAVDEVLSEQAEE